MPFDVGHGDMDGYAVTENNVFKTADLLGNPIPDNVFKTADLLGNPIPDNVFKTADLLGNPIPDNVLKLREMVQISQNKVEALGMSIFYREALPPQGNFAKGDILLLHGQAFSSTNWLEKQTLATFAAAGYRTIAVDLPGYGHTGGSSVPEEKKGKFVQELIENLQLRKPVLVSPSMSGTFALPLLVNHPDLLTAYVPVAPVGTNKFTAKQFRQIMVPTLIVYGNRDTSLGILSKTNLQPLPNGRILKIQNAGHAAYLDQPETFHSAILNFLDLVRTYSRPSP